MPLGEPDGVRFMRRGLGAILIGILFSGAPARDGRAAVPMTHSTKPVAATGTSDPLTSGVLVVDAGPRVQEPGWPSGLWHVTPSGVKTKLVGRRWRVEAWSPISGSVVRPRRFWETRPFDYAILVDGQTTPLRARAGRLSCASWSADGELLSYLTGKQSHYGPSAVGTGGKLWVVHRDSPGEPVAIARGLFPECPAWSPTERSLAYLIQGSTEDSWEMHRSDGYGTELLMGFHIAAPSVFGAQMNRTFDFSNGGELFFLAADSIYVASGQSITTFGPAGVLDEVPNDADRWLRYVRSLRVSPDGQLAAATTNWYKTGLIDSDELLRVVPNRFRAWSGNFGVVTFGLDENDQPTMEMFAVDPEAQGLELPPSARKKSIFADLHGQWFAHDTSRPRLRWYKPDGSLLKVIELGFRAGAVASTAGGIVDLAINP